jgi:hypothetical protein
MADIVLNISTTDYSIVADVANSLGWEVDSEEEEGDWDVLWTDFSVANSRISKIQPH